MADITLEAFYLYRPIVGQHEGALPTPEELADRARRQAVTLWGERPVLVELPTSVQSGTGAAMAWLVGPALNEGDDGSQLVVIWFPLYHPGYLLSNALDVVHESGGWEKHAKGYCL